MGETELVRRDAERHERRTSSGGPAFAAPDRDELLQHRLLWTVTLTGPVLVGAAVTIGVLEAIVTAAVVCAAAAIIVRPQLSGILLVAAVPALSGLARGFPIPGLRISDILIVGLGAVALTVGRRTAPRWSVPELLLLAYAVAALVFGALGVARNDIDVDFDVVGGLLGPFQFLIVLRAVVVSLDSPGARRRAVRAMALFSLPVSLVAIAQYVGVPGVADALESVTSEKYSFYGSFLEHRATGPFDLWHILGGYLLVIILLTADLALRRLRLLGPVETWVVLIPAIVASVLTLTFTTVLAGLVGVVVIAGVRHRLGSLLAVLAIVVVPVLLLLGPFVQARFTEQYAVGGSSGIVPQSVEYRLDVWTNQYVPALRDRVLLGYGPTVPPDIGWKYSESVYLELVLRGGFVLLMTFVGFMVAAATGAWRASHLPEGPVSSAAVVTLLLVVLLVPMHALFPYFLTVGLPHAFVGLLGVVLAGWNRRPGREPA